jgi:hypothetical protein
MSENLKLGVLDFFNQGMDEYTLIAVKAPLEETIQSFINISKNRKTRQRINYSSMRSEDRPVTKLSIRKCENILVKESSDDEEDFPSSIPFVAVKNSEWTVVLRALFGASDELYDTPDEAKALSVELSTRVITLIEEDTSAALAYELFENGDRLEYFEEACDDDFRFESKLRGKPNIKLNNWDEEVEEDYDPDAEYDASKQPRVQFVDAFFRELGIYLPAAYPVGDDQQPSLAVLKSSFGMIERADWLTIEMELETNEKIHDPDDDE